MNRLSPKTLVVVIVACLLGVVLALVGAELPTDTSFIEALPFWLTITCTAALLLKTVDVTISDLAADIGIAPLLKTSVIGAATALLVTVPVALMCLPIEGLLPDSDSMFAAPSSVRSMPLLFWSWADQYLNLLPAIAGFWLLVKVLDVALPTAPDTPVRAREIGAISEGDASNPAAKALVDPQGQHSSALERRFPEISGLRLLAIEADEHYVRLHTDAGSKHVLYRFRDALKDVEDLSGLRVHRSWWVAKDAIEQSDPSPSGFGLKLKGGLKVPVSQTYRRDVERALETQSGSN